jgi:hypothetical protein
MAKRHGSRQEVSQSPRPPRAGVLGLQPLLPGQDMRCGNDSDRTQHPAELFGDDWDQWELDAEEAVQPPLAVGVNDSQR